MRLSQMLFSLYANYVPILIGVVGVVLSLRAFVPRKNPGFLITAFLFLKPMLGAASWWFYSRHFVATQIGANTFTAPVRQFDVTQPLFSALLLAAIWFLYRQQSQLCKQKDENQTS